MLKLGINGNTVGYEYKCLHIPTNTLTYEIIQVPCLGNYELEIAVVNRALNNWNRSGEDWKYWHD